MEVQHKAPKEFDKRYPIEVKKVKDITAALDKIRKANEIERQAYCVQWPRGIDQYTQDPNLPKKFKSIIETYSQAMKVNMEASYSQAGKHQDDVAINTIGYLSQKYAGHKNQLKLQNKMENAKEKYKEFEFDRVNDTKLALLHWVNAQMKIHADALSVYSEFYDQMEQHQEGEDVADLFGRKASVVDSLNREFGLAVRK